MSSEPKTEQRPEDVASGTPTAQPARRPYSRPSLRRLGSVRDLTLGSGRGLNDVRAAGRQRAM